MKTDQHFETKMNKNRLIFYDFLYVAKFLVYKQTISTFQSSF